MAKPSRDTIFVMEGKPPTGVLGIDWDDYEPIFSKIFPDGGAAIPKPDYRFIEHTVKSKISRTETENKGYFDAFLSVLEYSFMLPSAEAEPLDISEYLAR
jgi:hypothetical protein